MAAIACAGTGVGFISVGFPAIPVMPQHVGLTALRTGGTFGAGRYAESTFLRFGVCAESVAGADVAGVAEGFPLAPVVRPVRLTEEAIIAIAPCLFRACGFVPAFRPMIPCKFFPAESAAQRVLVFCSIDNFEGVPFTIAAVRLPVSGYRRGCCKEQHNRQETCSQPFFMRFSSSNLLFLLYQKPSDAGKEPAFGGQLTL